MTHTHENVLVIPRKAFEENGEFQGFLPIKGRKEPGIYLGLNDDGEMTSSFMERDQAENNAEFKQIIPYIIILHKGSIFVYDRNEQSGEDRLHNKSSIGIGGHINDQDSKFPEEAYYAGLEREVFEEVGLETNTDRWQHSVIGLINDDSNSVGFVHLGIVHILEVNEFEVTQILDNAEKSMSNPRFVPILELNNPEVVGELESWSHYIAEYLLERYNESKSEVDAELDNRLKALSFVLAKAQANVTRYQFVKNDEFKDEIINSFAELGSILGLFVATGDFKPDEMKEYSENFQMEIQQYL